MFKLLKNVTNQNEINELKEELALKDQRISSLKRLLKECNENYRPTIQKEAEILASFYINKRMSEVKHV